MKTEEIKKYSPLVAKIVGVITAITVLIQAYSGLVKSINESRSSKETIVKSSNEAIDELREVVRKLHKEQLMMQIKLLDIELRMFGGTPTIITTDQAEISQQESRSTRIKGTSVLASGGMESQHTQTIGELKFEKNVKSGDDE